MSTIITTGLPGSRLQLMTQLGSSGGGPSGVYSGAERYTLRYRLGWVYLFIVAVSQLF